MQLFEDVVDILDPEMNLASDEEDEEGTYFRELDNDPESRTDSSHPVLTVPEKESPKDEEAKDEWVLVDPLSAFYIQSTHSEQ